MKLLTFFILSVIVFNITSCSSDNPNASNTSGVEDVFAETSNTSDESNTSENLNTSENGFSQEESSENNIIKKTPEELLFDYATNTIESEELVYKFNSELSFSDTTVKLNCIYNKKDNNIISTCILSTEDIILWENNDYFINGYAYIDDDFMKKCSFQCSSEQFSEFIKNELCYYNIPSSSTKIQKNETSDSTYNFEYEFTEMVLEENFFKILSLSLSMKETHFENGNCFIEAPDGFIEKAYGTINANAVFDERDYPIKITFNIECENNSVIITEEDFSDITDQYKNYSTIESFNFSKSLYSLCLSDAYEIYSNSRLYLTENQSKIYSEIESNFATSFMNERPSMSLIIETNNSPDSKITNKIYERYLQSGTEYNRIQNTDSNKIPPYTIVDINNGQEYSKVDSLKIWCPSYFDLYDASEFTVTETDSYYIINYKFDSISAIEAIKNHKDFYDIISSDFTIFSNESLENKESFTVENAVASATIRKSDFIIVEHNIDISVKDSENRTLRLVSSWEVMSLNDDTSVKQPNK